MRTVTGLHHVTAIAGPPQENLDFYAGVLGLRLVKKTVNQDDPGTYHLFYADAEGHAGTDITFFPWAHLPPGRKGYGLSVEVAFAVPPESLDYWGSRFEQYGVRTGAIEMRFGNRALPLVDVHGLSLALVETPDAVRRAFTPWDASPVPVERQIRGLEATRLLERSLAPTTAFLTGALGLTHLGTEQGWHRYGVETGGSGRYIDLREAPEMGRGSWGRGAIHHFAWRVDDDGHQAEVRARVDAAGMNPTPVIDRFWFKSVYFKEPGGVLFELATDGPGFGVDEDMSHLGESLVLPPWLEESRTAIEARLPLLGSRAAFASR